MHGQHLSERLGVESIRGSAGDEFLKERHASSLKKWVPDGDGVQNLQPFGLCSHLVRGSTKDGRIKVRVQAVDLPAVFPPPFALQARRYNADVAPTHYCPVEAPFLPLDELGRRLKVNYHGVTREAGQVEALGSVAESARLQAPPTPVLTGYHGLDGDHARDAIYRWRGQQPARGRQRGRGPLLPSRFGPSHPSLSIVGHAGTHVHSHSSISYARAGPPPWTRSASF